MKKKLLFSLFVLLVSCVSTMAIEPKVVFHYSENTENYEKYDDLTYSKVTYFNSIKWAKRILEEEKIPYIQLTDADIENGDLLDGSEIKYPLVISLSANNISDGASTNLIDYVEKGGVAFISGNYAFNNSVLNDSQFGINLSGNYISLESANRDESYNGINSHENNITVSTSNSINDFLSLGVNYQYYRFVDFANSSLNGATALINITDNRSAGINYPYLTIKTNGTGDWIYWAEHRGFFGGFKGSSNSFVIPHLILYNSIKYSFAKNNIPFIHIWRWKYNYDSAFAGLRHDLDNYYPDNWVSICDYSQNLGLYTYFYTSTKEGYESQGFSPIQIDLDNNLTYLMQKDYCRVGMHYSDIGHHDNDKNDNEMMDFEVLEQISNYSGTLISLNTNLDYVSEFERSLNMTFNVRDDDEKNVYGVNFTSDKYRRLSTPQIGNITFNVVPSVVNGDAYNKDWNVTKYNDSTVGFWKLDSLDLDDSSQYNNDLTIANITGVNCSVDGFKNNGCFLNGSINGGLSASDSDSLDSSGNLTLGIKIKINNTNDFFAKDQYFMTKRVTSANDGGYLWYYESSDKKIYFLTGNSTDDENSNTAYDIDWKNETWYCLVVRHNGTHDSFYNFELDQEDQYWYGGLHVNRASSLENIGANSRSFKIGSYYWSNFVGMSNVTIDQPLVYDGDLTDDKIWDYCSSGIDLKIDANKQGTSTPTSFFYYNLSANKNNSLTIDSSRFPAGLLFDYYIEVGSESYQEYNDTNVSFYFDNIVNTMFNYTKEYNNLFDYLDTLNGGYYGGNFNTKSYVAPAFGSNDYSSIQLLLDFGLENVGGNGIGGIPNYKFLANDKAKVTHNTTWNLIDIPPTGSWNDSGNYVASTSGTFSNETIEQSINFLYDNKLIIGNYGHGEVTQSYKLLDTINSLNDVWKTNPNEMNDWWRERNAVSIKSISYNGGSTNITLSNSGSSIVGMSLNVNQTVNKVYSGTKYAIYVEDELVLLPTVSAGENDFKIINGTWDNNIPKVENNTVKINHAQFDSSTNRLDLSCEGTGNIELTNMDTVKGDKGLYDVYHNGVFLESVGTNDYTISSCSTWLFKPSTSVVSDATKQRALNPFLATFSFIAIGLLAASAFAVIVALQSGNPEGILTTGVLLIGVTIVVLIGIFILGQMSTIIP